VALKKTVQIESGVQVQNAYVRVEGVSLTAKDRVNFQVRFYVDPSKNWFHQDQFECAYDLNKSNPMAQAYEYLKSLDSYANAQDC
jgi:hypothetical protein